MFGPTVADRVLFGSDGGRISYWTAADPHVHATRRLTGVGPGMWAPERIFHTAEGEIDFYIPHAHNVYLQTAAESGLIGLVAGVVVFVLVARLVWASLRGDDPALRRWAVAAILAAVYFGAHQLFDVFVNMPAAIVRVRVPDRVARCGRRRSRAPGRLAGLGPRPRAPCSASACSPSPSRWAGGWRASDRRCKLDEAKTALGAGDSAAAGGEARRGRRLDRPVDPARPAGARAGRRPGG